MRDTNHIEKTEQWLIAEGIEDVEIMISDCTGISRGKIMPRDRFIEGMKTNDLKLSESIYGITVDGEFCFNEFMDHTEKDMILVPQLETICRTAWLKKPTASVICHTLYDDGSVVKFAPRQVLQRVLDLYEAKGWEAVVAPEFEFYLIDRSDDLSTDRKPPKGKSGTRSVGNDTYSVDCLHEFDAFFDEVYACCEAQNIQIDTLISEAGAAQFEVNVNHGNPMKLADQSFYFKRLLRQLAIKHGMHVTFMARPYLDDYGSAMHLHQSVVDVKTGKNIFANKDGSDSRLLLNHIAGLQKYIPALMPFFAPYANSYSRFGTQLSAPTNLEWAHENRSVGLRVPSGGTESRRVENRISGSDANPYLMIAASLAAGYLGMMEELEPSQPNEKPAYDSAKRTLPQDILIGLKNMENCKALETVFDKIFLSTFAQIKHKEQEGYAKSSTSWETKYLLLTV